MHSSIGIVKGWCIASHSPVSSSYSKNGISVIQRKFHFPSGIMSSSLATIRRSAPRIERVSLVLPDTINTQSPFSTLRALVSSSSSPSFKNLLNEQVGASSAHLIYARPFAPIPFACSVSLSIFFLVYVEAAFLATIALTVPPVSTAFLNTTKSVFSAQAVISSISIPKRVSGLSDPYFSCASAKVIRGRGKSMSTSIVSFISFLIKPSAISIISSVSTNDISRSICVNSGCLSALKSSSLKQRAS